MSAPQQGIFVEGPPQNLFLEYSVKDATDTADVRTALASALDHSLSTGQTCTVGFGNDLWRQLVGDDAPAGLKPFRPLGTPESFYAPATQDDLWVWLQAETEDTNLDLALAINTSLAFVANLTRETKGMKYHGDRDLIGFVDGTGNPKTEEAKHEAALIPGGNGGAYAFTQKWVHNLPKFNDEPVTEQEKIVGRTKVEDIELEGNAMPPDSHVSRTDLKEDGVGLKIYRRSAPFGSIKEHGLYFLAFACDPRRIDAQLESMYGLTGDGLHDRLIEYSQAVTGAYWYVPGQGELAGTVKT